MVISVTGMLVDLSVAIMQVTVSVVIMQLEVYEAGDRFCSKYVGGNFFIVIMQMGVSLAVMPVRFSAVHFAHDCFSCNYAGDSFFYRYVGDSFD